MQPFYILRPWALLTLLMAITPASLYSQTYLYWDINGSGPGATDGTTADGTWDIGLTPNWNVSSNGSSSGTRTWAQASSAVFAAGTNATGSSFIEIEGDIQIPKFIVEQGNWTFTGGTLRVFSQTTLDIATASSATIHSSFEVMPFNAFDIWKTGGGNLTLTHNLTGQVDIRIDGGNLTFEATEDAAPVITEVRDLFVGRSSDGNLSVVDGTSFTTNGQSTIQVGAQAGVSGILTVTGMESTLVSNKPVMDVGFDGTGTLNVTEGGAVTATGGLRFGVNATGVGHGLVTGNNSAVTVAAGLDIGTFGDGTLTIADGGTVSVLGAGVVFGSLSGGTGVLHLNSGGVLATNGLRIGADGTGTFHWAGGTLRARGPFTSAVPATLTGTTSTIDSNGFAVTLSGDLSGAAALTKAGGGTATLTGNNTYTGGTTLAGGTLQIASDAKLGAVPAGVTPGALTFAGGALGTTTTMTLHPNRGIALLADGGTLNTADGTTLTYSGIIAGDGALTKAGTGTLTLLTDHTYTGGTTISGGTLQLGVGGSTGSILGNVTNNGTLIFNRAGDRTYDGVVSGSGSVVHDGSIFRLSAQQTYTGPTTVNSGILVLPITVNHGLSASTAVSIATGAQLDISNRPQTFSSLTGGGTVYSFPAVGGPGGHLTVDTAVGQEDTFSGNMGGAYPNFALTKAGEGTLMLSGGTPYTGTTTISQGSLVLPNGLPQNGGLVTVDEGGSLSLGANVVRALTNNGSVVNTGGDTLTLSGDLRGNGLFTGDFLWSATTRIGNSTGMLQVDGNLTFANTHALEAEIGGTVPGSEMDQVAVSGTLTLGGTLKVSFVNDFVPANGDTYSVLTAETFSGEISTLDLSDAVLPEGLFWDTQNLSTNGTLSVIGPNFELWADLLGLDPDPMADLQGDGFPLLVKYALGMDPGIPASTSDKPVFSLNQTGEDIFLRLTVNRTEVRSDVLIVGEVTNDLLGTWSDTGVDLIDETPEQLIFQDTIPLKDLSLRFMRIRFMLDTPNP